MPLCNIHNKRGDLMKIISISKPTKKKRDSLIERGYRFWTAYDMDGIRTEIWVNDVTYEILDRTIKNCS